MKSGAVRFIALCSISAMFSVTISAFPSAVAADITSVQTTQLSPQGSGTCMPLSAYGFTPYIYNGALHSFEFTIPDTSYVALAGTVGDTPIPFQFMTRHGNSSDFLRVHVDIQTTPINGVLPLSVTLLSAKNTGALCMSVVIMNTGSTPVSSLPGSPPAAVPSVPVSPAPPPSTGGTVITPPAQPVYSTPSSPTTPTDTPVVETGTSSTFSLASIQNRIVEACAMTGGALRLWIILLAMYLAVVAIAVLVQTSSFPAYSKGQRAASILAPLVLLLAFWYFAESCRATPWAPVAALLIAAGGLLALYWNDPRIAPYVHVGVPKVPEKKPEQKSPTSTPSFSSPKPMITPPPSKKSDA